MLIWKWAILTGLGFSFGGLLLMIEAHTVKTSDGKAWSSHTIMNPWTHRVAWLFTIGGYILQIVGVVISPN